MKTTNIFYRALCLVLMALCSVMASGQTLEYDAEFPQYAPQSPTAYAFAKYVDYPVSHYTGIPNISIPLYEISVGSLNIPISLSYHASGITASQEATRVGLGWNLNAGGVISRTVKCGDDFLEHTGPHSLYKGYFEVCEASEPISNPDFFWVDKEFCLMSDSEPDIYFYSLPGSGGKFVFGKDSIPVMFDKGDHVKIRLNNINGKVKDFHVWDTDGNLYIFDRREDTWSYGKTGGFHMNHTLSSGVWDVTNQTEIHQVFDSPLQYVSSWYLSRIITCTNDTVDFTYDVEHYQLPVQESAVKQNFLSYSGDPAAADNSFGGTRASYSCSKTIIRSYRLTGIVWKGGRMELGHTDREDIVPYGSDGSVKKVSTLKVYNADGTLIRDYAFRYDYFNRLKTGPYAHVEKRLKLTALDDCLTDTGYEFGYIGGDLPKKNSRNTDYWGYGNGSSQGVDFYPPAVHNGTAYTGGDKDPDFNYMKCGTLETIKRPTDGVTRFVYEANRYRSDSYYESITSHNYLNIYKGVYGEHYLDYPETQTDTLVLDKRTSIILRQHFEYTGINSIGEEGNKFGNTNYPVFTISRLESGGTLTRLYTYPIPEEAKTATGFFEAWVDDIILDAGTYVLKALQVVDEMYCEMYYGYDRMVLHQGEEITGGGLRIARIEDERAVSYTYDDARLMVKPVHSYLLTKRSRMATAPFNLYSATYLMQHSESTTPMTSLKNGNIFGYGTVTETFADGSKNVYTYYNEEESSSGYPFLTPDINYYNGLIDMKQTYDAGGNEVRNEYYSYSNGTAGRSIYGFSYRNYGEAYPYSYLVEYPYVVQKNVTETSDGRSREEIYNYTYNGDILPVTETLRADGDRHVKKHFYAGDFNDSGCTAMKERNMIATPVVSLSLKNNSVIAGKKTTYAVTNGMVLPTAESILNITAPVTENNYAGHFETRLQYSAYNACGQPMQTTLDGENRVYLWSYNGLYPVAEIKNATYSQVSGALGSGFITALLNKSVPTDSDISAIRALQTSLDDVEVTTYRYRPLVGVTEMTDCRGVTTGFTYDSAGRLADTWRKADGVTETLSTYEYNYAE